MNAEKNPYIDTVRSLADALAARRVSTSPSYIPPGGLIGRSGDPVVISTSEFYASAAYRSHRDKTAQLSAVRRLRAETEMRSYARRQAQALERQAVAEERIADALEAITISLSKEADDHERRSPHV